MQCWSTNTLCLGDELLAWEDTSEICFPSSAQLEDGAGRVLPRRRIGRQPHTCLYHQVISVSDLEARSTCRAAASFHQLLVIPESIQPKTNLLSRLHVSDHGIVGIDTVFNGGSMQVQGSFFSGRVRCHRRLSLRIIDRASFEHRDVVDTPSRPRPVPIPWPR